MTRTILHIDFDSFFASVEQQCNPVLCGRPIGVTARNGRTCIIASSREAKKYGVKTGTRSYDAKKLIPSIIFIPADFVKYGKISKKFITICENYAPTVEVFSIDEVFIDVTLTAPLFGGVYGLIEKFKQQLRQELGDCITASVGIAHNKLLAKLASGLKKPDGIMEIKPDEIMKVYQQAKLTDICGIGSRIAQRLHQMGIYTPYQLSRAPLSTLIAEFGQAEGHFLKNVGIARDDRPVVHYTDVDEAKSVGRQYCLPANEYDKRKILQNLYELCEEVGIKLRRIGKKARTVGVYLGGEPSLHGGKTFNNYFDTGKEIFEACLLVLNKELRIRNYGSFSVIHDSLFLIPNYVRQISIWTSNLQDSHSLPSPLLPKDRKLARVTATVDKINERFGDHTIRNGFLLNAPKLTTVPNGYVRNI